VARKLEVTVSEAGIHGRHSVNCAMFAAAILGTVKSFLIIYIKVNGTITKRCRKDQAGVVN